MKAAGVTAAAAVVAAAAGSLLGGRRRAVEASRTEVDLSLPRPLPAAEPVRGADLGIDGGEPWLTPNDEFYRIDTALSVPLIHPDDWRLRVHGMVDEEVVLRFDDLAALGLVDRWVTLCCVSNTVGGSLIGNALWTGVRVADVLGLAGPHADADAVLSTSHDGWTCGTPLDVLTDGRDALFAVAMNGEPLPVTHGFPVRMVVPGLYGYVSATKWVVDLEVSRFDDITAYWTSRGWSEQGPVKVASRIDVPRNDARVPPGQVTVAGVAWAQHRGISAVEVRVDGGPWQEAELAEVPSTDTWRQWVWRWDAGEGEYLLEVRAITADGEEQDGTERPPAPDGATGWHGVSVTVSG
jgi:DMSO/TMAO reductase YedYZ molybdopterin-dependent catalytic subunit